MIDLIMEIMRIEKLKMISEDDTRRSLQRQLACNEFKFIEQGDRTIGFFGWKPQLTEEGWRVYINNFVILSKYKGTFNFVKYMKDFLCQKYDNVTEFHWINRDMKIKVLKERRVAHAL